MRLPVAVLALAAACGHAEEGADPPEGTLITSTADDTEDDDGGTTEPDLPGDPACGEFHGLDLELDFDGLGLSSDERPDFVYVYSGPCTVLDVSLRARVHRVDLECEDGTHTLTLNRPIPLEIGATVDFSAHIETSIWYRQVLWVFSTSPTDPIWALAADMGAGQFGGPDGPQAKWVDPCPPPDDWGDCFGGSGPFPGIRDTGLELSYDGESAIGRPGDVVEVGPWTMTVAWAYDVDGCATDSWPSVGYMLSRG